MQVANILNTKILFLSDTNSKEKLYLLLKTGFVESGTNSFLIKNLILMLIKVIRL